MAANGDKRKQVIVNPKVQFRMVMLIMVTAFVPVFLLCLGFMMYSANLLGTIAPENTELIRIVQSVQQLNVMVFGGFLMILLMLTIIQTQFLHRIIGPLYRLEQDLTEMLASGNFSKKIAIRKNDYIQPIIDKINAVLSVLTKK